ncbi:hypothetical protein BH09MYX1_BH09MYX1_57360 [soil metagenome]
MVSCWKVAMLSVGVIALGACHGANAPSAKMSACFDPAAITMRTGAHGNASLKITNGTATAQQINTYLLENATLELVVSASDGKRMPSLSPPVPPAEFSPSDFTTIAPGESYAVTLGLYDFSPPLPVGTYELTTKDYPDAKATLTVEP